MTLPLLGFPFILSTVLYISWYTRLTLKLCSVSSYFIFEAVVNTIIFLTLFSGFSYIQIVMCIELLWPYWACALVQAVSLWMLQGFLHAESCLQTRWLLFPSQPGWLWFLLPAEFPRLELPVQCGMPANILSCFLSQEEGIRLLTDENDISWRVL